MPLSSTALVESEVQLHVAPFQPSPYESSIESVKHEHDTGPGEGAGVVGTAVVGIGVGSALTEGELVGTWVGAGLGL